MRTSDKIVGYTRGTMEQVLRHFASVGVDRPEDFEEYVYQVFFYARLANMDPSIAIAQASHETNRFRSYWWKTRLNPAGLGITGDPVQNQQSWDFAPDAAARAQLSHLKLYATGKVEYPFIPDDNPRYRAYLQAYGLVSKAPTIEGLTGTWAGDPLYAQYVVRHGNMIFGMEEQVPTQFSYCGRDRT